MDICITDSLRYIPEGNTNLQVTYTLVKFKKKKKDHVRRKNIYPQSDPLP